jgi:electron transport complex protein RnfC
MLRRIKIDWTEPPETHPLDQPFPAPERTLSGLDEIDPERFPAFLDEIGHVGMGGSGFQTSTKIRASIGVHTLVINGVECEPGITIDRSVLMHESERVIKGARSCAQAVGAKKVILAIKKDSAGMDELRERYPQFKIVLFPSRYPAGAEKLILKKLTGKIPAPGTRPYQQGYLIQNAVSLRAIGRALLDGIPVVERPLTLAMPSTGFYKNLIAPVGLHIRDVLATYDLPYDQEQHLIVHSGLMMGHAVTPEDRIEKTTLSLLIIKRKDLQREERSCIRCGACNTACPLGLHPFALVQNIKKGKTTSNAQLTECFLCGVCSAVCPSDIPLAQILEEGKKCL